MSRRRKHYDEELVKYLRRHLITRWRRDSVKECDGKCVISGEDFEVVHHPYPCNLIIRETLENLNLQKYDQIHNYTPEELELMRDEFVRLHYQYGLGICLTNEIHNEFHRLMGLNAKPEDFELYKYYKMNNLDLSEIAKCDLEEKYILDNNVKIYIKELEYILAHNKTAGEMEVLFSLLIFHKLYANKKGIFYASGNSLIKYTSYLNISTVLTKTSAFADVGLIEKIKRTDYYNSSGIDVNYLKSPNTYRLLFLQNIDYNDNDKYIELNVNDLNKESLYELLIENINKKFLKKTLPVRKYKTLCKIIKERQIV